MCERQRQRASIFFLRFGTGLCECRTDEPIEEKNNRKNAAFCLLGIGQFVNVFFLYPMDYYISINIRTHTHIQPPWIWIIFGLTEIHTQIIGKKRQQHNLFVILCVQCISQPLGYVF